MSFKQRVSRRLAGYRYVRDWSPVSRVGYLQAQKTEREYWSEKDRHGLKLEARYHFYAGFYEWAKHRELLYPFSVDPSRPQNFQIAGRAMEGATVLDVGCGPTSHTLSLVHCATVHVVDPLADFYRELQPFGWEFFASISSAGGEQLPFETESFDFVHCWNVLDHVKDADRVLREIGRVLRPEGHLLLGCDLRGERGGGPAHPYSWDIETLEARVFADFTPVMAAALLDESREPASPDTADDEVLRWMCNLRKKSPPREP